MVNHIGSTQRRTARDAATRPQDIVGTVDTTVVLGNQTVCAQFKRALVDDQYARQCGHIKFRSHIVIEAVQDPGRTRNCGGIFAIRGLVLHLRGQAGHMVGMAVDREFVCNEAVHAVAVTVIDDGVANTLHRDFPRFGAVRDTQRSRIQYNVITRSHVVTRMEIVVVALDRILVDNQNAGGVDNKRGLTYRRAASVDLDGDNRVSRSQRTFHNRVVRYSGRVGGVGIAGEHMLITEGFEFDGSRRDGEVTGHIFRFVVHGHIGGVGDGEMPDTGIGNLDQGCTGNGTVTTDAGIAYRVAFQKLSGGHPEMTAIGDVLFPCVHVAIVRNFRCGVCRDCHRTVTDGKISFFDFNFIVGKRDTGDVNINRIVAHIGQCGSRSCKHRTG